MNAKNNKATAEEQSSLKQLNKDYTNCISRDFLPKFLAGENVSIDNFCVDLRTKMLDLDKKVYH